MNEANISYDIENINIDSLLEKQKEEEKINVFENFEHEITENFNYELEKEDNYAYYLMLEALGDNDTMTYQHRSIFDQYWLNYYNNKAENYDTDLMNLRFV